MVVLIAMYGWLALYYSSYNPYSLCCSEIKHSVLVVQCANISNEILYSYRYPFKSNGISTGVITF